jgi:hypothetical protein
MGKRNFSEFKQTNVLRHCLRKHHPIQRSASFSFDVACMCRAPDTHAHSFTSVAFSLSGNARRVHFLKGDAPCDWKSRL